jgi:hypothetical protein
MKNHTPGSSATLQDLLKLHDEDFVRSAYLTILGRSADPEGLDHYLTQVRAGTNRAAIIADLAESTEGKRNGTQLIGLENVIAKYGSGARSIWARLFKLIRTGRIQSTERQFRIIENRLYVFEQQLAHQTSILFEVLALAKLLQMQLGTTQPNSTDSDVGASGPTHCPAQPNLSPSIVRTFDELKTAIARKRAE